MPRWWSVPFSCFRRRGVAKPTAGGSFSTVAKKATTTAPHTAQHASPRDAHSRYYDAKVGETFKDNRYEAIRQIGEGKYSRIWLANGSSLTPGMQDSIVALKLLTFDCYGSGHDIFEREILDTIGRQQRERSEQTSSYAVEPLGSFQVSGPNGVHECFVTPVVGGTVHAHARRFPDRVIPVSIIKEVTRQLLKGLAFSHDD
ncbi:uncharacterized protein LTR77_008056 [Saxophila tyrrhenica]|uniref:non-specific serine/threonine protein kinase n=1 Tax=Saxophila tyrrhenica TaxID=1690608 RepID=A0AAV9P521_9PEZI|nr:hypothetical protein LTR77_008056 [Saxophila tyrrhenica]